MKSPLRWVGGKFYLTKQVISLFPSHQVYVEVFGGAGHVLFTKNPSPLEVYNDIDENVINFFKVLRDNSEELYKRLEFVPYSRKLFYEWRKEFKNGKFKNLESVEWACKWFTLVRQSYASNLESRTPSWGYNKRTNNKNVKSFNTSKELLLKVAKRLLNVQIECLDFRKIFEIYDDEDTLFYCDPPYIDITRYYDNNFVLKDHIDLANILNNVKGKVILSYYPHKLLDDLYKGWNKKNVKSLLHSLPIKDDGKRIKVDELLLYNFKAKKQLNFLSHVE